MNDVKPEQESKQPFGKLDIEEGIVMVVKPEQDWKHRIPKLVTDKGILIDDKLVQFRKLSKPKVSTILVETKVTDLKLMQK